MRIKIVWIAALLLAAAVAAFFLRDRLGAQGVAAAPPMRGTAVEAVYATGTVEPVRWAKIAPTASGRIVQLLVKEGERVEEGAILARLDDRDARANLAQLAAKEIFLKEELARQQILAEKSVASRQSLDRAKSDYDQTRAAIDSARKGVSDRTLIAPLSGQVLRREGEAGELADPLRPLYWIGEPMPLRVVAEVDERDIPLVATGQKAGVRADAFPGQVMAGAVGRMTPLGDANAKTFRVYIDLPDTTPLRTGMTVEVNIVAREVANALLVPATAVRRNQVWIIAKGQAALRPVRTGAASETSVEILDGLGPDDLVVTAPSSTLKEGTRLRPLP